jgi:hypothetical protein
MHALRRVCVPVVEQQKDLAGAARPSIRRREAGIVGDPHVRRHVLEARDGPYAARFADFHLVGRQARHWRAVGCRHDGLQLDIDHFGAESRLATSGRRPPCQATRQTGRDQKPEPG